MKALFLALVISTFAVPSFAASSQQVKDLAAVTALINSVKVLAAADLSCETTADCVAVNLGSRACGGPSTFAVASKTNENFDLVEELALKSHDKEMNYNKTYHVFSVCSLVYRLPPTCVKNLCK